MQISQGIVFILTQTYCEIFKPALAYFKQNERLIWQKLTLKFHSQKIHDLTLKRYFKKLLSAESVKLCF